MNVRTHPLAPVIALDIDGTLGDYYQHFRWFCQLYLQRPVYVDWSLTTTGEFSEALGLEKAEYRDAKLAYRQGGMKRCMPLLYSRTAEIVQEFREMGVQVWIATTRPWNRLDNIDPDTQFWINNNIGQVDGVIYGEDKYKDLIDIVGKDRIIAVVDDLPENVTMAAELGLGAWMIDGDHNRRWRHCIPRVYFTEDIIDFSTDVAQHINVWVANHGAIPRTTN